MTGSGGSGKDEDLGNVYELLELDEDVGEKEIKTAYRKLSLKCHPDRNPDDPEAAQKFDRLTRAKDLLLDPIKRSEIDRKRKAERDLQERHAQEDSKRRKLREDLEGRESVANAKSQAARTAAEAAAARKKYLQQDFAERIRAREAELTSRQQGVADEFAEARDNALEARLKVSWKGSPPSLESICKELEEFGPKTVTLGESSATVQLESRETAIRAVLECRARKSQMPFRVALASKGEAGEKGATPAFSKPVTSATKTKCDGARGADFGTNKSASFEDWEAQMMADLQHLAAKQNVNA
eukprot:TRINITY_DN76883_c0_g1_i1.p1 TRINITY_DN76883_c0_g1~~TRINITY_DN76883_c0_g1_i1.p1  ORF type:complete len:299 (-),score=61.99 TRINITY_DN76883_c0_g1_i1:115-1011(-)